VGLARAKLWPALDEHLQRLTVADPACGSGSFLVGMLHILDDLRARAARQLGRQESAYDRKKGIIGRSLYGVDVMEWACHVAELRLWLALIIDVQMTREELHIRREPLLPHFSFKVRCGDSLVQEVGGISLAHRRGSADIPKAVKDRLRRLQNAKLAFYSTDVPDGDYEREKKRIEADEVAIFRDLLAHRAAEVENQAKALMRQQVAAGAGRHLVESQVAEDERKAAAGKQAQLEVQIAALMEEAAQLKNQQAALHHPKDVPLVWDIAFAEVMESDAGGFDIVIGNPPYVRQENIAAPVLNGRQVTQDKKEYKAMLARSVYHAWPTFFGYKAGPDTAGHKIDAKSDLYVYFYFHGLSLLNTKGSFCFITSNSWLDVGYGADLQEFLLRHGHVKMVIDNQVKRSFASADVNTVIALLSRPDERRDDGLARMARFVMFKAPFEQVLSPIIFEEIEDASARKSTAEFRVCCLAQDKVFEDGCETPLAEEEGHEVPPDKTRTRDRVPLVKVAKYVGAKWGGVYLRAPDIYWAVLDKSQDKLAALGRVATVFRGITTGANEFFFLEPLDVHALEDPNLTVVHVRNGAGWEGVLERSSLQPAVQKTEECHGLLFTPSRFIFYPGSKLAKRSQEYVRYGEHMGFNARQTCAARPVWWQLRCRPQDEPHLGFNYNIYDTGRSYLSDASPTFFSDSFHIVICPDLPGMHAYLNSTLFHLFVNISARVVFGGGKAKLQTYELGTLPVLADMGALLADNETVQAYRRLCRSAPALLCDEIHCAARRALDARVFELLGLSGGEGEGVYEAVTTLIQARLKKAESV